MWIRTESGLYFITQVVVLGSFVYGKTDSLARDLILGTYQSEGEAREVLDMIHDHLNDFKKDFREVFEMPLGGETGCRE